MYANNSIVASTDIGSNRTAALICVTNNANCCVIEESGDWYFPDGTSVLYNHGESFYSNRGSYVVSLMRNSSVSASSEMGMFWCLIADVAKSFQYIYVGVYPSGIGEDKVILASLIHTRIY